MKSKSQNALTALDEVEDLRTRLSSTEENLHHSVGENERLADELSKQQLLYNELKKMRGQDEAMDMLQQLEQVRIRRYIFFVRPLFSDAADNDINNDIFIGITRVPKTNCVP